MASNMMLDGYIVESVNDNKKDGGQSATVGQPVPLTMPEPRPAPPSNDSNQEVPAKSEPVSMPVPLPTGVPAPPPAQPGAAGILEETVVEEKKTALRRSTTSSSSSSNSSSRDNKEKPTDYENIEFEVKDEEVISHDPILSRDVNALSYFVEEHGSLKPDYYVTLRGTHTEKRTRVVRRDGRDRIETYTVTIVDFEFSIDISSHLKKAKPIVYTVADHVPAFRGGMRMATEPNGPTRIESRRMVTSDEQDIQESWEQETESVGRPPWISRPRDGGRSDEEAYVGLANKPLASGRSVEEWLTDYIQSRRVVKDFKVTKSVYGWNTLSLSTSLTELVEAAGYRNTHPTGHISVEFTQSSKCVHIRSPNFVSKIFSSKLYIFLTCLILVFPFLWLWRRFWPGAGGKWAVMGTAFPIKHWELVRGTTPGETVEAAQVRLGGKDLVPAGERMKRLRVTPEGVWILRGTHESEWFREWQESILAAVKTGTKSEWLHKMKLQTEEERVNDIANNLDHV